MLMIMWVKGSRVRPLLCALWIRRKAKAMLSLAIPAFMVRPAAIYLQRAQRARYRTIVKLEQRILDNFTNFKLPPDTAAASSAAKIAFARGAARQWQKPFSIQASPWFAGSCTISGPLRMEGRRALALPGRQEVRVQL